MQHDTEAELEPHQRDYAKESQILLWVWNILEEVCTVDFGQFLRDGTLLCRLMNHLCPGAVPGEITAGSDLKHKKKNISNFLTACQKYGVPENLLFEPDDLLLMRHIPRVTRCLFALGKQAKQDNKYSGPQLGDEPLEPVPQTGRRRSGMPLGDDLLVSHVSVRGVMKKLPSFDGSAITSNEAQR